MNVLFLIWWLFIAFHFITNNQSFTFFSNELGQPLESFRVSHSSNHGAHENFDGADALLLDGGAQVSSFSGGLGESQVVTEFFFAHGSWQINFIAQNHEWSPWQVFNSKETLNFDSDEEEEEDEEEDNEG